VSPMITELLTHLEVAIEDHPEDATDFDLVCFAIEQVGDDPDSQVSEADYGWLCSSEGNALGQRLLDALRRVPS